MEFLSIIRRWALRDKMPFARFHGELGELCGNLGDGVI